MDNRAVIIVFGLLGLGLLFMLARGSSARGGSGYSEESVALPFRPASRVSGAHHYTNEETWDIEWNEEGLPKRVTIHRNAVQT